MTASPQLMNPPAIMNLTRQPRTECDEHHKNAFFSGET
jgi:hypothetical protein